MRSIEVLLFETTCRDVESRFDEHGFERLPDEPGRWNYPGSPDAVLYVSCSTYRRDIDFAEEHAAVIIATGGRRPTVSITADVSGRVPGDSEVMHFVELILGTFDGVAFDDYTSLDHAWTIQEIRSGAEVAGLHFFDYLGYHAKKRDA